MLKYFLLLYYNFWLLSFDFNNFVNSYRFFNFDLVLDIIIISKHFFGSWTISCRTSLSFLDGSWSLNLAQLQVNELLYFDFILRKSVLICWFLLFSWFRQTISISNLWTWVLLLLQSCFTIVLRKLDRLSVIFRANLFHIFFNELNWRRYLCIFLLKSTWDLVRTQKRMLRNLL